MTAKEQGLPELPQNVTEDQRRAIQSFVHSAIVPLIEDVIVKKLGQAAIVLRDELSGAALASDTGERGVVMSLMHKFRALVAAHDGEFAFIDGVKLCLRELESALSGCQSEGRELPKHFVECSESEKASYMRGIAVGENIASRDPVFAALDSVVPGWREHGSDTARAAATAITELSARATSNGAKPFRWDDDEGEAPGAWGPK